MKNKPRILWQLLLICLLIITCASTVFAEGGQSSSPGTPGQKPLALVSISLEEGGNVENAANIPTQPKFKIVFDKNVVNSALWANNRQCFSLSGDGQTNIPIIVSKIDDTVDFTQRQNVFVQPVNSLTPGTTYRLFISPDLLAKNGNSTLGGTTGGQGVTITFKTEGQAPQPAGQTNAPQTTPQATQASQAGQDTGEPTPLPKENTQQAVDKATEATKQGENTIPAATDNNVAASRSTEQAPAKAGGVQNLIPVLFGVLVVGWIVLEYFVKRRGGRKG